MGTENDRRLTMSHSTTYAVFKAPPKKQRLF